MKHVALILALNLVLALLVYSGAVMGSHWSYWPYSQQDIHVKNSPAPGGGLDLEVSVVRLQPCASTFYREIYDGQGNRVLQTTWTQGAKPVGPEKYGIHVDLPADAKPGPHAKYCIAQAVQCNLIQNLVPHWTALKCVPFVIKE